MRPTLLHFRAPAERTGELIKTQVDRDGRHIEILQEKKANPKGTNLPKESRFPEMKFYDIHTG